MIFRTILLLFLMFISTPILAFNQVNGKYIVLLTSTERRDIEDYQSIINERARNVCRYFGKELMTYSEKELPVEYVYDYSKETEKHHQFNINDLIDNKNVYLDISDINKFAIPEKGYLRPIHNKEELENKYHRGGVATSLISL